MMSTSFVLYSLSQAQEHHTLELRCKPEYHRFLIGRQGSNIRRVRDQFGARIIFPQKSSDDDSETVMIIGTKEKAMAAKEHLEKLIKDLVRVVTCIGYGWVRVVTCVYYII